jgi:hypothetical protein
MYTAVSLVVVLALGFTALVSANAFTNESGSYGVVGAVVDDDCLLCCDLQDEQVSERVQITCCHMVMYTSPSSNREISLEEFLTGMGDPYFVLQEGVGIAIPADFIPAEFDGEIEVFTRCRMESIFSNPEMGYVVVTTQAYGAVYVSSFEELEDAMAVMVEGDSIAIPVIGEPVVFYCLGELMEALGIDDLVVPMASCHPHCPGGPHRHTTQLSNQFWFEGSVTTCQHVLVFGCTWRSVLAWCGDHRYSVTVTCSGCNAFIDSFTLWTSGCGSTRVFTSGSCARAIRAGIADYCQ